MTARALLLRLGVYAAIWPAALGTSFALAEVAASRPGPEFPRAIIGRVTVGKDHPLPGVRVEWGYFRDDPDERESVETDADGRYRLETTRVGRDFRLGFSKPGFAPIWFDRVIPGPASKPSEQNVVMSQGTTVTVQFTTRGGEPVAGVDVTPYTPSNGFFSSFSSPPPSTAFPGRSRTVVTDADGRLTLADLPDKPTRGQTERQLERQRTQSWLRLELRSEESWIHEAQLTETAALGGEPVVIQIPDSYLPGFRERQSGVLRGRVVDKATGQAIEKYHVTIRHRPEPYAVDDRDGKFEVGSSLENGREYEVRILARDYAVETVRLAAEAPDRAIEPTFRLSPHPSPTFRIVDAETGEPLPDVRVLAGAAPPSNSNYLEWPTLGRYADGYHGLTNVLHATTDSSGQFAAPEAPNAPATLVILTPGFERRIIPPDRRPPAGPDGVTVIPVARAASVTAIAVRETPIGGAADSVWLYYSSDDGFRHMDWSMDLDESGRREIDSLAAGNYRLVLYLRVADMSFPCYSKSFKLAAGQHKDVLLGDMPGVLKLSGQAGAFTVIQVSPKFETDIGSFAVQADIDGRFELSHLLPGEYSVTLDVSSSSSGYHSDMPSRSINLTEDMEIDLP